MEEIFVSAKASELSSEIRNISLTFGFDGRTREKEKALKWGTLPPKCPKALPLR